MRPALLLVLGVLAALSAGCGQSNPDLIPTANAETLQATADRIQAACENVGPLRGPPAGAPGQA